jgi:hypothetical protein
VGIPVGEEKRRGRRTEERGESYFLRGTLKVGVTETKLYFIFFGCDVGRRSARVILAAASVQMMIDFASLFQDGQKRDD